MVIDTALDFIVILACILIVVHDVSPDFTLGAHVKLTILRPDRGDFVSHEIHIFLSVNVHSLRWADHGICSLSNVVGRSDTLVDSALTGMELTVPVNTFHGATGSNFISRVGVFGL